MQLERTSATRQNLSAEKVKTMQAAKEHILKFDPSFAEIFNKYCDLQLEQSQEFLPLEHLCRSIISQQLSLKAAAAVYEKFKELLNNEITPGNVLVKTLVQFRVCGLSVRKVSCLQDLAAKFNEGVISDRKLM